MMRLAPLALLLLFISLPLPAMAQPAARRLVVMLHSAEEQDRFCGAGIIFDQQGDRTLVLTAAHNLRRNQDFHEKEIELVAEFSDSQGQRFTAKALPGRFDKETDLAVLEISGTPNSARLSPKDFAVYPVKPSQNDLSIIGHANCELWSLVVGGVSLPKSTSYNLLFQAPAVMEGNSGGALIGEDGSLLGLVYRSGGINGQARPIEMLVEQLDKWGLTTKFTSLPTPATSATAGAGLPPPVIAPPGLRQAFSYDSKSITVGIDSAAIHERTSSGYKSRELKGTLLIYGLYSDGQTYLLATNPDDDFEIRIPAFPQSLSVCGIVAVTNSPGRYLIRRSSWALKQKQSERVYREVSTEPAVETTNAKACEQKAKSASVLKRLPGPITWQDLPVPMFHVVRATPQKGRIALAFQTQGGGMERVSGGQATVYAPQGGQWRRIGAFPGAFEFENPFVLEYRMIPLSSVNTDRIAICSVRTVEGETFAGWDEIVFEIRSDGSMRRPSDTVYRSVDAADPCGTFLH